MSTSRRILPGLLCLLLLPLLTCKKQKTPLEPGGDNTGGFIHFLASDTLLGRINYDVWGYVDPGSGREYALVGHFPPGVSIVEVTDPQNPRLAAFVDSIPGFDIKTWQHYMYTVTGADGIGGTIVDLSDPESPQVVGSFPSAHNIFISDTGYLIAERAMVRVYDLDDPLNPQLLWQDGADGHDAVVVGDTLYDFHGGYPNPADRLTNIYDFSTPAAPQWMGAITDPLVDYHHSGWPSRDGRFLFICNELAGEKGIDILAYDISDIENPERAGTWSDENATVHNFFIIGDRAFVSYYSAGFRVFDVSDPHEIRLIDEWDTSAESGVNFLGAFGVYPFAPSGTIYVSDRGAGLFLFRVDP